MRTERAKVDTRLLAAKYPKGVRIPKYRLHKPSGRAVIQYRPLFGPNPRYLNGAYGSEESIADYHRQVARIVRYQLRKQSGKLPKPKPSADITVKQFLARFLVWATEHHGGKGNREFDHFVRAIGPLRTSYGNRPLRTIGPVKLKRVRKAMVTKGWCRTHVNAQFNRLRAVFKWGVEEELVKQQQFAALHLIGGLRKGKTKAPERPAVAPIAWDEAAKVLAVVPPVVAAMAKIQYLTGMRSAELTAMRRCEIDCSRDDVWIYQPKHHKTEYRGKPKFICIGPQAQALLMPYLTDDDQAYLFSPRIAMRERLALRAASAKHKRYGKRKASRFNPNKYRARYYTDSYFQALAYGFDRLDRAEAKKPESERQPVERWHPHRLRHTRATATREVYGREGAESQLGNSAEATEIYAEKNLPLAIRVAIETG